MASIFVSHASKDDLLAGDLAAWLRANAFTDLFVDDQSIKAGSKWREELRASAGACRVAIFLVTPNWLGSGQCEGEFNAAWYMGKRLLPLYLVPQDLPESARETLRRVMSEDQGLDLQPFITAGGRLDFSRDEHRAEFLRRSLTAAGALSSIGLDPEAFEIDRGLRPSPFPGLSSFGDDDADAACFFGRSREIIEVLEELRGMRAARDRRALMILGASGAGKSSLLKAGVIPRLRREAPAWIPLRSFRPGADPLLSFAEAIARTLSEFGVSDPTWVAKGALRRTFAQAWTDGRPSDALDAATEKLRVASNRPDATILICVDQAEELARADGDSGDALAAYLRSAMDVTGSGKSGAWRVAFTIRTDSFLELQSHPRFHGLEARGYDLRAMPTFRFDDVVTHPAKRYGVTIDDALIDTLVAGALESDALPLVAFTMQRLWDQFSKAGRITLDDFRSVGGLSQLIGDSAESALAGIEPAGGSASSPLQNYDLARQIFVADLAIVREDGIVVRRLAGWSEFSAEAQELLSRFMRWRLVVRKGDTGTVEVAHEALFREWPRLRDWLREDANKLQMMFSLEESAPRFRKNKSEFFKAGVWHDGRVLRQLKNDARFKARLHSISDYLTAYAFFRRGWLDAVLWIAPISVFITMASGFLGPYLLYRSIRRSMIVESRLGVGAAFVAVTLWGPWLGSSRIAAIFWQFCLQLPAFRIGERP